MIRICTVLSVLNSFLPFFVCFDILSDGLVPVSQQCLEGWNWGSMSVTNIYICHKSEKQYIFSR